MWKYKAMPHVRVLLQHLLEEMKTTSETLKKASSEFRIRLGASHRQQKKFDDRK
jgi:hypothetical protein